MAKNEKIILLALTTTSAGTQNITKRIIEEIDQYKIDATLFVGAHIFDRTFIQSKNVKTVKFVRFWPYRLFFEFFILPIYIKKYKAKTVVSLANFLFTIRLSWIRKVILIRHPYLLEENLEFLPFFSRIKERLRKIIFYITLLDSDRLVCQTNHMKSLYLKSKFKKINVVVIPNPLSTTLTQRTKFVDNIDNSFLYPSRYYKHKNHEFVIDFVTKNVKFCEDYNLKFIFTVEKSLFKKYEESKFIQFKGEISQLSLNKLYDHVLGVIFPSNLETFGNGLIESAFKELPIIVPNLPYARTILDDYGFYYTPNDFESFKIQIMKVINLRPAPNYQLTFIVGTECWINELLKS